MRPRAARPYEMLLLLALLALLSCERGPRHSFTLATTTSVQGSGALEMLQREFKSETGIEIHPIVSGSGKALQLAASGDADATITHDPAAEQAFVAAHHPRLYRQFMWNDFVIVGPANDPADVAHAASATDAFARIARTRSRFTSRNDQSGTHTKELAFWKAARVSADANPNYRRMGQPMAALLRATSELQAYTLTDRATFDQLSASLQLRLVYEGDPALRNVYAVMLISPDPQAARFVEWLLHGRGRTLLERFEIKGRRAFHML
jgi:tungstate transport system substrate-binding protein